MNAKLVLTVVAVTTLLVTGACALARGASIPTRAETEVTDEEFLKANNKDMAGKWRTMEAPVFKDLKLGGAPVVDMKAIAAKPNAPYAELFRRLWYEFNFDSPVRQA